MTSSTTSASRPTPAPRRPRGAREDGQPRAHPVDDQVARRAARARSRARVGAGDDRDPVAPRQPARDLAVQVRAGAAALRVGPVAIGQHRMCMPRGRRYRGCRRRPPTMAPVHRRLPTAAILLTALALAVCSAPGGDGRRARATSSTPTRSRASTRASSAKPHSPTSQSSSTATGPTASAGAAGRPDQPASTSTSVVRAASSRPAASSTLPADRPERVGDPGAVGAALVLVGIGLRLRTPRVRRR